MKRIFLIYVTVFAITLTTACGGSTPNPTSPPIPTQTIPATPAPQLTAPTQTIPATPAPQLTASINNTEVNVTLEDNTIKSSQTTFQAGVPYTFVILNAGRHAHNFNIAPPVSLAGSLDSALASALLIVNRDQLQVGESVRVEYTFPDSAVDQPLEFSCLIPRHYDDGMLLPITVTK